MTALRPGLAAEIVAYSRHHSETLDLLCAPQTVPGGEQSKNDPALVPHLYAMQAGDGWAWGIGWGIGGEGFAGYRRFSRALSVAAMPVV